MREFDTPEISAFFCSLFGESPMIELCILDSIPHMVLQLVTNTHLNEKWTNVWYERGNELIFALTRSLFLRHINRLFSLLAVLLFWWSLYSQSFIAYMFITQFGSVLIFAYYINIFVLFPFPLWNRAINSTHNASMYASEYFTTFDLDLTANFGFYSGYIYVVCAPSVQLLCILLCSLARSSTPFPRFISLSLSFSIFPLVFSLLWLFRW